MKVEKLTVADLDVKEFYEKQDCYDKIDTYNLFFFTRPILPDGPSL